MFGTRAIAALLVGAGLSGGAAASQAATVPRVLWSSGAESGDLSSWGRDGGGGVYNSGTGEVRVERAVARSGRYAIASTITGARPGAGSQATRLFRWQTASGDPLPAEAHYGVWLLFPRRFRPDQYWNVFQWKTRVASGDVEPTFVVSVDAERSGAMFLYLWDAIARRERGRARIHLPAGQWVHLEAFYRWSTRRSGRVVVWQDGHRIIDVRGIQTALPSSERYRRNWSVDNYTNGISPSDATIYSDDASISLGRLGQRWRAAR